MAAEPIMQFADAAKRSSRASNRDQHLRVVSDCASDALRKGVPLTSSFGYNQKIRSNTT